MSVDGHYQGRAGVFPRALHLARQRVAGDLLPGVEREHSQEHASGHGDAVGRDRHGCRAPAPHRNRGHRPRSVAALARRAAGAFLLATFALLAFAPGAEAQTPDPAANVQATATSSTSIRLTWEASPDLKGVPFLRYRSSFKLSTESNFGPSTDHNSVTAWAYPDSMDG